MAAILKTVKTLRNHWKKTTFGVVVLSYAASSAKNKYDTNIFMEACCKEAEKYGEELIPVSQNPRSITVILNPAANKRSAKKDYENYCEPLLHLAGISVKLVQTNAEGHAKELVVGLPENESIVVAGGDGTLGEALTGLLRENENKKRTIGILPLGRRNQVGNSIFPLSDKLPKVKQLAEATMAIIKNESELKDIMKIEVIEENSEQIGKPIYAMGTLEWGAFRDALARRDKYWIYGSFRDYATYIFNGYKNSLSWDCKGSVKYSPPCEGCKTCKNNVARIEKSFRWLDFIMPKEKIDETEKDYSLISNDLCGSIKSKLFETNDLTLTLERGDLKEPPHICLNLGKKDMGYIEFVSEGWKRANKKPPFISEVIKARTIELLPENLSHDENQVWYAIDNEEFDVKPVKVSVLPRAVRVFCKK